MFFRNQIFFDQNYYFLSIKQKMIINSICKKDQQDNKNLKKILIFNYLFFFFNKHSIFKHQIQFYQIEDQLKEQSNQMFGMQKSFIATFINLTSIKGTVGTVLQGEREKQQFQKYLSIFPPYSKFSLNQCHPY
ncbi:hypothetical protein ABPG72_017391 [Tetrahymena utriculariae]